LDSLFIQKEILINAPIESVFSALTTSDAILNYFPLTAVESDWVVGGEVLYRGEVNGVAFTDYGVIEELTSPNHYAYRYWSDNHGTEKVAENYLTISYRLEKRSNGTLLMLEQRNIRSAALYELMNNQVWDYLLASLKGYAESVHST